MPMQQPATIMDVAKAAGVSFSTVSLALRHPLRVREKTREKIDAAAKLLGYERNPTASALASRVRKSSNLSRSSMIAYVTGMNRDEPDNNYSDAFLSRLHAECERMGYGFESVKLEQVRDRPALARGLRARGCVGVVFGQVEDTRMVDEVDWRPFSMVRCNNSLAHLGVHRVESDVFEAAWEATGAALKRGYRKLGLSLFRHGRGFDDDVRRTGAFRVALEEAEGTHSKTGAIFSHNGKWDRTRFMRWFEKHPMDALVCFGVVEYYWLIDAGIRVPQDVGIVALTCAGESNSITGYHEDFERITQTAFRACEQSIRAREPGFVKLPQAINIPCLWHEGETLPKR
jgi:LacI family transcriptional regulator